MKCCPMTRVEVMGKLLETIFVQCASTLLSRSPSVFEFIWIRNAYQSKLDIKLSVQKCL